MLFSLKKLLSRLIPRSLISFTRKFFVVKPYSTRILKPFRIDGARNINIGSSGFVGDFSTLSSYNGRLLIGNNFFATRNLNIYCAELVDIGDDVLIGSYVLITDMAHGMDADLPGSYQTQTPESIPVKIGDGTWIGDKASILPGTKIGKRCIVGANSVVKGTFAPYSMICGNPAKVVKVWDSGSKRWNLV